MDSFGKRLTRYLRQNEMTQSELAEKAQITTAAVSHYVHGKRLPQMKVLARIADALGVSVQELLGEPTHNVDEDELKAACRLVALNVSYIPDETKAELLLALAGIEH